MRYGQRCAPARGQSGAAPPSGRAPLYRFSGFERPDV